MKKKVTVLTLSALLSALCFPAQAQQSKKVCRVGYLANSAGIGPVQEAFRQGLRELGYTEGQNVLIEWRFSRGEIDRNQGLATELVKLNMDCIVAVGVGPTRAAKEASGTIPIVMANADDDPIRYGLVASLARPGGNITGFINIGSELAGKRLELLKETVPKVSRVAMLRGSGEAAAGHEREAKISARTLGVNLQSLEVSDVNALEHAFQVARSGRAEALTIVHTGLVTANRTQVVNLVAKTRLPAIYSDSQPVLSGGLMSYSDDSIDRSRRVADYVARILKGTKPADLPVQRPAKFEFIINLKAAKQIGLTIPPNVLVRADRVIR
jgi:ABC-type uncharacterized transport system substrate-binding protein